MRVEGKKALVVGLGRSGLSASRLLLSRGAKVTVTDSRPPSALAEAVGELLPLGVRFELGGHDPDSFTSADLLVVSPGVPLSNEEIEGARRAGVPVLGELQLAASFISEPLVGVTGTNGKSTTTALIAHLLETGGLDVFAGGNLGTPLSERVLQGGSLDFSVVEASSYQLEASGPLRFRVAVLTNLAADHLDRYPGVEAYWSAKKAIFRDQGEGDFAVLNGDDPEVSRLHRGARSRPFSFSSEREVERGAFQEGSEIVVRGLPGSKEDERYGSLPPSLRGSHGRQNAMAAILAARLLGVGQGRVQEGLASFLGLPHRLQSVRTLGGVEWINDSKATNVQSAQAALAALEGPVLWIAGGKGKGAPYESLRDLLPGRVSAIFTIGEDGERIGSELGGTVEVVPCGTVEAAVHAAAARAVEGDVVLFSPACASFDQFSNFEERGEAFAAAVRRLP